MTTYERRKYILRTINGRQQVGVRPFTDEEVRELFHKSYSVVQREYETPCWEWLHAKDKKGYGIGIVYRGVQETAHRLSWLLNVGEIPSNLFVCHHCDNSACCRPDHLFLGTNEDNMDDAHKKGRCIGEGHWNSNLKESDVREMRRLRHVEGLKYTELMSLFHLTKTCVASVIQGRTWKHIL